MSKITNFIKNNLFYIPALLIFVSSLISGFYTQDISAHRILVLCIIYLTSLFSAFFLIYSILYYWRNLPMSFSSYIFFSLNFLQLLLYLWSMYITFTRLTSPIYLKDLSVVSQYRYLLFTIISLLFIIGFVLSRLYGFDFTRAYNFITFPYLKEEVRLFLYSWNQSFFLHIGDYLLRTFYYSKKVLYIYLISHFIIFHVSRYIALFLLIQVVWFGGDLRNIIFLCPIFFIVWILSFLDYYFQTSFNGHCNYIRLVLSAKQINPVKSFYGIVKTPSDNIVFEIKPFAYSEGFTDNDIESLIETWRIASNLSVYFSSYNRVTTYLNRIAFLIQVVLSIIIVHFLFIKLDLSSKLSMLGGLFRYTKLVGRQVVNSNGYATEACFTKNSAMLSKQTQGVHHKNHPAIIDRDIRNPDNPSEVRYYGQATHGRGTPENPSELLHPTRDLDNNPKAQYYVPAKGVQYCEEDLFDSKEMPGSKQYFEDHQVKTNKAKHTSQEENT